MLKIEKVIKLPERETPINLIKIKQLGENHLNLIDSNYRFYIFDKNLKVITKEIVLIKDVLVDENYKALDLFENQIALAIPNKPQIAIVEISSQGLKKKTVIDFHSASIEFIKYSNSGKYLLSASHDGHIYIFNTQNYQVLTYLAARKDFICSASFSSDDRLILLNYFDKTTAIFDMLTYSVYDEFSTQEVAEAGVFYKNNSKIFLLLRGGKNYLYDIKTKELRSYESFDIKSTLTYQLFKERYLLISDKNKKLFIFDLINEKVLANINYKYLISAIYIDEDYLYFGANNSLGIIDKNYKVDEIEIHFMVKNYFKISKCIEDNILLKLNEKFIKILNSGWEETLPQIIEKINEDRANEARQLAYPFFVDEKTEQILENYFTQAYVLKKFNKAVEVGNLGLAYGLALNEKNPFLRETSEFRELEKYWLKILMSVKKYLKSKKIDILKQILAPFFNVPIKKELIHLMLNKPEKLEYFDELAFQKDYQKLFEEVDNNPFFKESDSYKRIMHLGSTIYAKFNTFFEEREYEKCKELAKTLSYFNNYQSEISEKLLIINNIEEIKEHFENSNFKEIFEIISNEEKLFFIDDFYFLIDKLNEIFHESQNEALKANPKSAKELLNPLMEIDKFKSKIRLIMKLAYINELQKYSNEKSNVNWQQSVDNFVNIFGNNQILIYHLNKLKLNVKVENKSVKNPNYLNSIISLN